VALRAPQGQSIVVDGEDVVPQMHSVWAKCLPSASFPNSRARTSPNSGTIAQPTPRSGVTGNSRRCLHDPQFRPASVHLIPEFISGRERRFTTKHTEIPEKSTSTCAGWAWGSMFIHVRSDFQIAAPDGQI
jgi:hypothetical protein